MVEWEGEREKRVEMLVIKNTVLQELMRIEERGG